MKTIEAVFTKETVLLIQGIKGKIDEHGIFSDVSAKNEVANFINGFKKLIENAGSKEQDG